MAWEDITHIEVDFGNKLPLTYPWNGDLILQINVKSTTDFTVTYDLRMYCKQISGGQYADYARIDDTDIWIGPADKVPSNTTQGQDSSYKKAPYWDYGNPIVFEPNSVKMLAENQTATYNSDGTLTKNFGICFYTPGNLWGFNVKYANYTFPKLDIGGKVSIKTSGGWKNGQVFVKTSGGWKEAKAIYIKTSSGWKEAK